MLESSEFATIRRLPDGSARTARIASRSADRLTLVSFHDEPDGAFDAGALVEIDSSEALYLGEVIGRQKDSLVTVVVEHFIDRAALAEIERVWKTAEGA